LFVGDIWLGKEYLLSTGAVIIICLNYYVSGMMHINDAVKSSGGLYDKDKWVPLAQSAINIVASIILVKIYGLTGVFIGTLLSSILPTIVKPIIMYKYLFDNKNWLLYFGMYFKQLFIIVISALIVLFVNSKIILSNAILMFIVQGFIALIIPAAIILLCYYKTEEFQELKTKIKIILKR